MRARRGAALFPFVVLAVAGCSPRDRTALRGAPEASAVPERPGAVRPEAGRLTLLTYNVLADPSRADERVPELMRTIARAEADVIALQEVAPWFVRRLAREEWASAYRWTLRRGEVAPPGGLLIMSRSGIDRAEYRALPSRQGRGVLVATVRTPRGTVAVGTVHLESFPDDGPTRARQLEIAFGMLEGHEHAVLLGDFNFGEGEEPETSTLEAGYVDVWTVARPGKSGLTWNVERSPMARRGSFPGEGSRRIDRVLARSPLWRPVSARIIGDEPVSGAGEVFPSDHFGLVAVLVSDGPGRGD